MKTTFIDIHPTEVFKGERNSNREHLCYYTAAIIEAMDHISAFFPPLCRRIFLFTPFLCFYFAILATAAATHASLTIIPPNTTLSSKLTYFILLYILSFPYQTWSTRKCSRTAKCAHLKPGGAIETSFEKVSR